MDEFGNYEDEYYEDEEVDETDEINCAEDEQMRRMEAYRTSQIQLAMSQQQGQHVNHGNPEVLGGTDLAVLQALQALSQQPYSGSEPLSPAVTRQAQTAQLTPNAESGAESSRMASVNGQPIQAPITAIITDETIIEAVKPYRIIWGVSSKSFKDTESKSRAWIEIGKNLHAERKYQFSMHNIIGS